MILGVGTDIVEIQRMEKSIENTGFLKKYFTEKENEFFLLKKYSPQSIAATFAAKEAVSKAFGTGFRGFSLKDIEILRDNLGKPYINLYNEAKKLSNGAKLHLSLSHTSKNAVAFVVMEKE